VSLRTRLLLAVGAVAFVALLVADVATYSSFRSFLYQRVDASLLADQSGVTRVLDPHEHAHDTFASVAPGTFLQTRDHDGRAQTVAATGTNEGETLTPRLPATITGLAADGTGLSRRFLTVPSVESGGTMFRVLVTARSDGGQLVLAVPLDDTIASLNRLVGIELAVTSGALLAALLLGWWLVKLGLQPLLEMEATADAIAEGDIERRVGGDEKRTEVGRLARALNSMLGRIQDAFAERDATESELRRSETRLRRFVADASHELRTPLSAVAAYAELYERGAKDRAADLPRLIAGIRLEAARMGDLVEDLLLLARLDEGRSLDDKPVELVGLAAEAVAAAQAVGPQWPVTLDADHPVEVRGDATRLRQVIDNLLANVRAHTPEGTAAAVRVATLDSDEDGPMAEISVIDHGPGLASDDPALLFERFYRADPSRSRQEGGTGLGLAIVAGIVAAHDGAIEAHTTAAGGAAFVVRLPAAPLVADGDDGHDRLVSHYLPKVRS
jgi:two-component system OmpR family sensor kinase